MQHPQYKALYKLTAPNSKNDNYSFVLKYVIINSVLNKIPNYITVKE